MKNVIIDKDCICNKWIVCEAQGPHTVIIAKFDWFVDAREWCDSKGFSWR